MQSRPELVAETAALSPVGRMQTFASTADRARLTPAAIAGFRRLASIWGLTSEEAAALLGVEVDVYSRILASAAPVALSQDQLFRASALFGVFKGLQLLFADDMADRWPRLANSGPLFDGKSPIDSMIEGGIPQMLEVRLHVDALRGGL